MSNFIINTVRIKNRNVDYLLLLDEGESGPIVTLRAMNNELFLEEDYGMPNRDAARSFIDNHSPEFIKQVLVRIAMETSEDSLF